MQVDFAALLVIAAVVTGSIWVLDALVLAPRRARNLGISRSGSGRGGFGVKAKLPWYVDFSRSFFPVIVAVLVLRSFVIEPFRIPSSSMEPTLYPGDFILVSKFAYGLRLPVLNSKFLNLGAPERGDVVVFRYPRDPATAFIKRVVGLPGDHIEYRSDKQLYVNGAAVAQSELPNAVPPFGYEQRTEQLGAVSHAIQIQKTQTLQPYSWRELSVASNSWSYDVPAGHYFVMGDNRDNSSDSRVWGPMPEENLIGKAFLIWMNLDCVTANGNCNRIGRTIE